eukprot:COSAG01_NODE_31321_length_599_cov_3.230000_1_plen_57_part_00
MDRVLRAIKNFCAAGKIFLEYSRYTLKKKIPLRTGGRNAPQAKFFLLSRFFLKKGH